MSALVCLQTWTCANLGNICPPIHSPCPPCSTPCWGNWGDEMLIHAGGSQVDLSGNYESWCCCSVVKLCPTLWDPVNSSMPGSLSFTISWSLLKLMSIELVMPCNHLILCRPLPLWPSIFPSIMVFSSESVLHILCQSIGASASIPMNIPMNIQDWSSLGLTGLILLFKELEAQAGDG